MNAARKHSRSVSRRCVFQRQAGFDSATFDVPPRTNDKSRLLARLGRFVRRRDAQTPPRAPRERVPYSTRARRRRATHDIRETRLATRPTWSANRNARSRSSRAANNDCFVRTSRHESPGGEHAARSITSKKPCRLDDARRRDATRRLRVRDFHQRRAPFSWSRRRGVRQRGAFVTASPLRGARLHEPTPLERDDGGGGGRGDSLSRIRVFSADRKHCRCRERLRRRPSAVSVGAGRVSYGDVSRHLSLRG